MPAIVVLGAQWGDEGKGKATDLLATNETIDFVVRTSGGHNAGHTIVVNGEKFATHLLPSGILTPGATCVIANGVVVSPEALFRELDALIARGVDLAPLVVSANAHVLASYHATIDKVTERFLGNAKLGTTGRGIGPTYADKINRIGIRVADLFDEELLRQKVEASLEVKNQLLAKVYNRRALSIDAVVEELLSYVERLRPMVADTSLLLNRALDAGQTVLFEGAQATMLDVDHGTYPVRHLLQPDRRRRVHRRRGRTHTHRPGDRRDQGLYDPGRLRTRSRPSCSTRTARSSGRSAARSASRPAATAGAAGTTPSSPATPRASTASPTCSSPSSTCSRRGSGCRSASPTTSTASVTTRCR